MTVLMERRSDVTPGKAVESPSPAGALAARSPRHIVHIFPSFGFGGVPLRIVNVINLLGGTFRHSIVSLDGCYDSRVRFDDEALVDCVDYDVTKNGVIGGMRRAAGHLRDLHPDLLATYNWGSIEWALANTLVMRGRHVHFESGFGPEEADGQIRRRVWTRRLALLGATSLVVPSRTLERIAAEIWRIPTPKIRRVANGVDVAKYVSTGACEVVCGFARHPGELIVGTVAPLRREKNLERLLRAFAAIPDIGRPVRLLIAGDGDERAGLERLAEVLGIGDRTVFLGHVDAVEKVLGLIDVFAMSSDTEQMPNALLQAMAAGCAVAAVDVGDVGIIVARENYPFIVPRDEPGVLTDALVTLLRDDVLRTQTARANLAHVRETYSMERMLMAYRMLYEGSTTGVHT